MGAKAFNPGTYTTAYANMTANLHKDLRKGSIKPMFKAMLITGLVGYWMEWYAKERHHVAHKREIVEKAMAAEGHH